jgi:type II secretory pathway pseudopilin PulG
MTMKSRKSKRYITLLELLIVFSLLSIAAGAIAYNIRGFFRSQSSYAEMDRFVEQLRNAQNAMMLLNIDSEVKISTDTRGVSVEWVPKSPISQMASRLFKPQETYHYLTDISFQDAFKDLVLKDNFSLSFLSKGFLMNRGVLKLQADKEVRYLLMPGYPWPFHLSLYKPTLPDYGAIEDIVREITNTTAQETL